MARRFYHAVLIGIMLLMLGTAGIAVRPVYAASVTVNNLAGLAFGGCTTTITICTLPDAVAHAASGDTINFSVTGTIFLSSSVPPITKNLTIDGSGQSITIDGQSNAGIGSIFIVNTAGITLNLANLTIQNGSAGSATSNSGGAMYIGAAATVNVTNCTFSSNHAINPSLGGGAIEVFNSGATLNVDNSAFANNATSGTSTSGGAIDNEGGGTVNIANSTFTGNSSTGTTFGGGGVIFTWGGGKVNVANSTFYNNLASSNGAGGAINANPGNASVEVVNSTFLNNTPNAFENFTGVFILQNSIVTNGACDQAAISLNNLVDNTSCGPTMGHVTNLDTAPANNGGPNLTVKLLPNSNAIDGAPAGQCDYPSGIPNLPMFNGGAFHLINFDQRGIPRAQGPRCDIGAYEVLPGPATTLVVSGYPSPVTAGTANDFQVSAYDATGYVAYGYTGTVHFSTSDMNALTVLPGNYTFSGSDFGMRQFSATLTQVGTQSIRAQDTVNSSIKGAQNGIQVNQASASKLAFAQQPTSTVAGAVITPAVTVQVQDAYGNPVSSGAPVTLSIGTNAGGGTLTGTLTQSAVNGVATFNDLSIDKTGVGYTLSATSFGFSGGTSSPFTITPGVATKLAFIQQPTNAVAGSAIAPPVTVALEDALDNVVTTNNTLQITLALAIGSNPIGTLSGGGAKTVVNGVATFGSLSIDKAGNGFMLFAASVPPMTPATSSAFNILAATPTPTSTRTPTITRTPSKTATATSTRTITRTATSSRTPTVTATSTISKTPTVTRTPSVTRTLTITITPSVTRTPTVTRTPSTTRTPTLTRTPTRTSTATRTPTASPTRTATRTPSSTATPSKTRTPTNTFTPIPAGKVTPTAPSGTITTGHPTYVWTKDAHATEYYLLVGGSQGIVFSQWYDVTFCAATCRVTPSVALTNGSYTFWVLTWNGNAYGPWSNGLSFTVTNQPPAMVAQIAPLSAIMTAAPTFTWDSARNAEWYYLLVQKSDGTLVISQWYDANTICAGGMCSVTPSLNLSNGAYTWWVQSWGGGIFGPMSPGVTFTEGGSAVSPNNLAPTFGPIAQ